MSASGRIKKAASTIHTVSPYPVGVVGVYRGGRGIMPPLMRSQRKYSRTSNTNPISRAPYFKTADVMSTAGFFAKSASRYSVEPGSGPSALGGSFAGGGSAWAGAASAAPRAAITSAPTHQRTITRAITRAP